MERLQTGPQAASLLDMPCDCGLRVEALIGSSSLRSRLYAMGILCSPVSASAINGAGDYFSGRAVN